MWEVVQVIKYIGIYDTNNRHIEIDYRTKPMHDYPRGEGGDER